MRRTFDLVSTAIAPAISGSTYLVTTQWLPDGYPLLVATARALPAGLLLLLLVRQAPEGGWWLKIFVLGALNFSIFWWLLFVSAYDLPGGVAATVGAIQPLIVILLARMVLGTPIRWLAIVAAIAGLAGVALLILTPSASLNGEGIAAGLGGAASMAAGTVLSRRWQPSVSPLTFTAWQLTPGGSLLLPFALWFEAPLPHLTTANILALSYLCLIGAALTYVLWFRGVARLGPAAVSPLVLLSPVVAVALGWGVAGQTLSVAQLAGMVMVVASLWLGQQAQNGAR